MSTYKAVISYLDMNGNTQHYDIHNIIANGVVGATMLAMDDFSYVVVGEGEVKKIVVELQQSTRMVTGDLSKDMR